jgi:hypothetical protein
MGGAAILTSASDWRYSPAEPRVLRSRPEHGFLLELLISKPPRPLRCLTVGSCEEVRTPRRSSKNDEAKLLAF